MKIVRACLASFLLFFSIHIFAETPTLPTLHDYRGVIHCHSELSYDSRGRIGDIEKAAAKRKVDFVILTDHWSQKLFEKSPKGFRNNILFIPGTELSQKNGMSLLAFPLTEDFIPAGVSENHFISSESFSENIIRLQNKGAIVYAGHTEKSRSEVLRSVDGFELMNLHAHWLIENRFPRSLAVTPKIFLPWNWNLAYIMHHVDNRNLWHDAQNKRRAPFPMIVGIDTHDNKKLFNFFGPKLGSYERTFRLLSTHIWTRDELSETAVIEALHRGQAYAAFDIFGDPTGFLFYAVNHDEIILPGGITTIREELALALQLPKETEHNLDIRVIKNGAFYSKIASEEPTLKIFEPGIYTVEIYKHGKPWIFSNGISVQ